MFLQLCLGPITGREEGEKVYVTVDDLEYTVTGSGQNKKGGRGRLVITGVGVDWGGLGVAPVHLNGAATRMDDGRVNFKGEFYSPCESEVQIINVAV